MFSSTLSLVHLFHVLALVDVIHDLVLALLRLLEHEVRAGTQLRDGLARQRAETHVVPGEAAPVPAPAQSRQRQRRPSVREEPRPQANSGSGPVRSMSGEQNKM